MPLLVDVESSGNILLEPVLKEGIVLFIQRPVEELQINATSNVEADMLGVDETSNGAGETDDDALAQMDIRHDTNFRVPK